MIFYVFSTTAQTVASLLGLAAVFVVLRHQELVKKVEANVELMFQHRLSNAEYKATVSLENKDHDAVLNYLRCVPAY